MGSSSAASSSSLALEIFFWAFLFLGTAMLLFSMVYTLVMFGDLSRDHVNPIELCECVNRVVPFEYGGHVILASVILLRGYIFTFLTHVPLMVFHARRVQTKRHLLDNTQVFSDMPKERRISEAKLGFYIFSFFVELYQFIRFLVS